jgi:hypothetical protein
MLIGPGAMRDAGEHVECEPPVGASGFMRIRRMAEPPELTGLAREPED